ncbi:hypothetical protein [Campylobacter ureolyticus]|uniref:hypothetical protein n=1 Tax=Campylobacter ureolyticus TaxID=827 RepID=UPI0022B54CBE|nr:hypothetical protein [Campylobacter ureolyticus]MCZ6117244.1 hypothetical protein [Campylobacter ureolyticus]
MQEKLEQKIKFFDLLSFIALQPVFIVIFWYVISYIVWAALLVIYMSIATICSYLFDNLLEYLNNWFFSMIVSRIIAAIFYINFFHERFKKIKSIEVIISEKSLKFSIFTTIVCIVFTIFSFLSFYASKYNIQFFIVVAISFIILAYCFKKRGLDC